MYHSGLAAPWKKGQSGNPGGRPKQPVKMTELARRYGPEAINLLVEKMRHGEDDRVQVMAAKILLDRGYGTVAPQTEMPLTLESVVELSRDELMQIANSGRGGDG